MNKCDQYTAKLLAQVGEIFKEESDNYINPDDFNNDDNATAFFHALFTLMQGVVYNNLTGQENDMLAINHLANRLCAQQMR